MRLSVPRRRKAGFEVASRARDGDDERDATSGTSVRVDCSERRGWSVSGLSLWNNCSLLLDLLPDRDGLRAGDPLDAWDCL